MRRVLASSCLVAAVALSSCTVVSGSNRMAFETRPVAAVTRVQLDVDAELTIERSGRAVLQIAAEDNVLPVLTSEVVDHTLHLGRRGRTSMLVRRQIRYRLVSNSVTSVDLAGAGSVVALDVSGPTFSTTVDGSGTVTLAGNVAEQQVSVSGAGHYVANGLTSSRADVRIAGSGRASVLVTHDLKVEVAGHGRLTYAGDPVVERDISGSGQVIDASAAASVPTDAPGARPAS